MELMHAERLIGKMKYTQSKKIFSTYKPAKFTSPAFKICAIPITPRFVIVFGIVNGGSICSLSVVNDLISTPANEFDNINTSEYNNARKVALNEYGNASQKMFNQRQKYLEMKSNLNHFDSLAIMNQMKRMFYPNSKYISLTDLILKTKNKALYPFVPSTDEKSVSAYEVFHFLKRADILPQNLMTFPDFLMKFAPEDEILDNCDYSIGLTNHLLPVRTDGYYKAISNIAYSSQKVTEIICQINPLANLNLKLNDFTISQAAEGLGSASISRKWLSRIQKEELSKRIDQLENLEDLVKHELMKRVQDGINEQLTASFLDKMLPVPPIDLRIVQKDTDPNQIQLTVKPNRNIILDDTLHKTIYDTKSKYTLYGRDREQRQIIHALHIPEEEFDKDFTDHIAIVQKVSFASRKISLLVNSFGAIGDGTTRVVIGEGSRALPLSHFLKVHSFLGSDPRSLGVANSILCKSLQILYSLHKLGIILRTFYPENIYLNVETSQTMIGSIFDAQFKDTPILPLPEPFNHPSNPFLPPEYFHEPLEKMTTAFDVWQLGMLLLYTITGYLPKSYGLELLEHLGEDVNDYQKFEKNGQYRSSSFHRTYPRTHFFYDWLKDAKMVGPNERCTGERGECFIRSDDCNLKNPTILDLDHYTLLPYKNSKINYDESKLYLLIIASCLQTDPAKRPQVEDLLRTYCLGQPSSGTEALDVYLKVPNQDVFTSQFFYPITFLLKEETFFFTMGVLQALMFHDEDDEDDGQFAFPLENHAADRILKSVFNLKILDKLVEFAIKRVISRVKLQDVVPTITFSDQYFERLLEFLMRIISSVEKGIGPLVPYTMETVLQIMSLFACNHTIRFSSSMILSDYKSISFLLNHDHSPAFMYTYYKVHGILKYILSSSISIAGSIKFTDEHSEWYFNNFLNFGEANYNISHALCYSIDKQKGNSIKTLQSMWNNGQTTAIARIFNDFRIIQKVLCCLYIHNVREEALSLLQSVLSVSNSKLYDASFRILNFVVMNPIFMQNVNHMMRISVLNDKVRENAIQTAKEMFHTKSPYSLIFSDILFSIFETIREPLFKQIVDEYLKNSNPFLIKFVTKSNFLSKILRNNFLTYNFENSDQHYVDMATDVNESLVLAKNFCNLLYLQNNASKDVDYQIDIKVILSFFYKSFGIIQRESDSISKYLDQQVHRENRFDLKETTFLQEKNKQKEFLISQTQNSILEISVVCLELYKQIAIYMTNNDILNEEFLDVIFQRSMAKFGTSRLRIHPSSKMISFYTEMISFSLTKLSKSSPVFKYFKANILRILDIFNHYFMYYEDLESKNLVESQLSEVYVYHRKLRFNLFKTILIESEDLSPFYKFIEKMLSNHLNFKLDGIQCILNNMKFSIRSEALDMIDYLTRNIEKYKRQFFKLCEVFNANAEKFVENERKMMQVDDNVLLIDQSIKIIEIILNHNLVIEDNELRSLLISIRARYQRQVEESKLKEQRNENRQIIKEVKHRSSLASTSRLKTARRTNIFAPNLSTRNRPATVAAKRSYGVLK
ncbi:hypothetical protein TVAG_136860 [Trichomonas vaginalis G3]|uniref:non-specific serine/threonine protein kinase n=1 Tax=Trichomonas vaginalis (strain ATCC PRA-98 / G3) TaxID=412133 RepID=A2GC69_TRIV3|nr:serine/threonine-protein kinase PIM family [Trichomonas vaginalis G3]EAX85249.1 hypothetical protein TVAG_136860 [Trichomonas vaginalis G3]KAI5549705.1 serine/threonine-protein kinase PIM family [Trichomonas vaginalis G3]|eukprot:XP_001298179.1 hypothetical protein [Trichomonas vaginalis G3]